MSLRLLRMRSFYVIVFGAMVAAVFPSPIEPSFRAFVAHSRMGKQGRLGNQMFQW
jgi:hypothetical protein